MADKGKEVAQNEKDYAVVGKSRPRLDAKDKVTGSLKYIADMECLDAFHAKVLRSPYPHALIKKIDTSKAEALPGVVAVMTAKDVPGRKGDRPGPAGHLRRQGAVCG
jgi:CO/xanthine dehydrogenase Mo-binding subunit